MTPTAHLRFVERTEPISTHTDGSSIGRRIRILQQWWANDPNDYNDFVLQVNGEWRDIPFQSNP